MKGHGIDGVCVGGFSLIGICLLVEEALLLFTFGVVWEPKSGPKERRIWRG